MPVEVMEFPENIKFKMADWVNEEIGTDREGYDLITACVLFFFLLSQFYPLGADLKYNHWHSFSITKWIHLQGLNPALFKFFSKAFKTLAPGGKLILEPHPFHSYNVTGTKVPEDLKRNYELMKEGSEEEGVERGWREEDGDFERILLGEIGFERKERLGFVRSKSGEFHAFTF